MIKRYGAKVSVIVLVMIEFSGCPQAGPSAAGAWVFYLDPGCDDSGVQTYMAAIHADNTVEFYGTRVRTGTWSVVGSTMAITLPNVEGSLYIFTATLESDLLTDGALSIDGAATGCVAGQRLEI